MHRIAPTEEHRALGIGLRRYLTQGMGTVKGWLAPGSALVISNLLELQLLNQVPGDVAEIGVYHGRTFILLAKMLRPGEAIVGIDPFAMKGESFRQAFEGNLAAHGVAAAQVRIQQGLSKDLSADQIAALFPNPVRFFHIDGDHSYDAIQVDLALAERLLHPEGIIVMDDFLHSQHPDVTESIFDYLKSGKTGLVPFLQTENPGSIALGAPKLFLCRREVAPDYLAQFRQLHAKWPICAVRLCGAPVHIYPFGGTVSIVSALG